MARRLPFRGVALDRLRAGESANQIAGSLGCSTKVVTLWAKQAGIRLQRGGLGGVPGVSEVRRRTPVVKPVEVPQEAWLDQQGRLSAAGRVLISIRLREGSSQAAIARELGVHRSTVSREVARCPGTYSAAKAQRLTIQRRLRPKPRKLVAGRPLWQEVVNRLNMRHSPEQIAARLRADFPDDPDMWVCHETIYQALYVQGAGGLRHELAVVKALRSGRKGRKPASKLAPRSNRSWIGDAQISQRPAEAGDRSVPGHWEGDLIIGAAGRSALVTLNERTTRYTMIHRLTLHDSITVTDALIAMTQRLPNTLLKSLTWDQGVEMAHHARFTIASGCQVYFCDPHSPWQRPTNENSNGLIRDFFPKGTDFATITDEQVHHAEYLLNTRPRRVLNWATPAEKLEPLLNVAPTT